MLSIVKTESSCIPLFALVALSAKGEPCHVTAVAPFTWAKPSHMTVESLGAKVSFGSTCGQVVYCGIRHK